MTVETNAAYISDLNKTYPRNRDLIKEGDDHIRLVKSVLQTTFPGMDRAVTPTAEKLNKLDTTFTYSEDTLSVNNNFTLAEGKTMDVGGAIVKNASDPEEGTDLVTLQYLQYLQDSAMWPVGSIFFTADARNPKEILGFGTWQEFGAGRVIIGSGSTTDTNNLVKTFANGDTGGEFSHSLTEGELAAHSHEAGEIKAKADGVHSHQFGLTRAYDEPGTGRPQLGGGQDKNKWAVGYNRDINNGGIADDGSHTHETEGSTSATGEGTAHNNIQPYIVCNIWLRVADPTP